MGTALTVLYLLANGPADETLAVRRLRLDREYRDVQAAIGEHEAGPLTLVPCWAATAPDVVNQLNSARPHVVHFAGHAGSGGLDLDHDGSLRSATRARLRYRQLARILGASDTPPRLVVLNACESAEAAEPLLAVVPVVVGMTARIDDDAAACFAAAFYRALAARQPVAHALGQARTALGLAGFADDEEFPALFHRASVRPRTYSPHPDHLEER